MSKSTFQRWARRQLWAGEREYPVWQRVGAAVVLALLVVAMVRGCHG